MNKNTLIEEILGNATKIRVLQALKTQKNNFLGLNELSRLIKVSPPKLSRALDSLKNSGIADYIQTGKSKLWRLIPGYPLQIVLPILTAIDERPSPLQQLKDITLHLSPPGPIKRIVVFGSMANETADPDSDIDIFIHLRGHTTSESMRDFIDAYSQRLFEYFNQTPSLMVKNDIQCKGIEKNLKKAIEAGVTIYEKN